MVQTATMAQSPKRRAEQAAKEHNSNAGSVTTRAQISFPVEAKMNENVVWRRDVYRELDITKNANAALYYPIEPVGSQMNLFTYIFKLFMTGNIPVYEYRLDGNESYSDTSKVKQLDFLKNYHIYYERTDRGVHLDDSDIPSKEVMGYYLKESYYFDQNSATFHTKVLALCPIMERDDDFGDGKTKYPLFWVKYDDLAPFLTKQTVMTSNLNNASVMSLNDYFTMNLYKGNIYKTANMLGQTLAQYCTTDSTLSREQQNIEKEISRFEQNIWGDQNKKDSIDSISRLNKKDLHKVERKSNRRNSETRLTKTSRSKASSSSGSAARVTVRRQRH